MEQKVVKVSSIYKKQAATWQNIPKKQTDEIKKDPLLSYYVTKI